MSCLDDCVRKLHAEGLEPVCDGAECADFGSTPAGHAFCLSQPPLTPVTCVQCYSPVLNTTFYRSLSTLLADCMQKMQAEPQNQWTVRTCYCCCGCYAYGTALRTAEGLKSVETLTTSDRVMALDDPAALAEGRPTWTLQPVVFTGGAGAETAPPAVSIGYGDNRHVVAPADQLVMTGTGKLKAASRLVPGRDEMRLADGTRAPVTRVARGTFAQGSRHVAASDTAFNGSVGGHLLDAEGVVVGDYVLQLNARSLSPELLADAHWDLPELGTPAYAAAYPHLEAGSGAFATVRAPA
ncbi:MAG TPA: hypothetical protein VGD01_16885 [Candidatus Elarobacter sp.]